MNTQNILNYNIRKTDLVIDSSEYYDVTLCNDQIDIDNRLLNKLPIFYESNVIDYNFVIPNESLETITLTNSEGIIFTLPFDLFSEYFGDNYKNIFLPTNHFILNFNSLTYNLNISNFNEPIDFGPFDGFNVNEILNFFDKEIILSENIDENNPKKFIPYPQQIKFDNDNLFNVRENIGWTWEMLFNPSSLVWSDNSTFLYLGMRGDDEMKNLSDNSLSFSFNNDMTISYSYPKLMKICGDDFEFETITGKTKNFTPIIDENFLVTLVFRRYYELYDCDLLNKGGENDFITDLENPEVHKLSKKWLNGGNFRKGKLSIYVNGKIVGNFDNFDELVMSNRGTQPYIVSFGGLSDENNPYNGSITDITLKKVKYFNEPLKFTYIKHNYLYNY